jgi:hypothetical protein
MRSFYYLKEAAYELELNQRAEVKDVVKQILSPDDGNPFLTVSVYFPDPKRLITRGKCEKNGELHWFAKEEQIFTALPGVFDILRLPHTPIGEILNNRDVEVRSCRWPDGDGLYPLNLRTSGWLYIYVVQSGIVYELQDKITCRESDLVISRENLVNYAEERGITLKDDELIKNDVALSKSELARNLKKIQTEEIDALISEITERIEQDVNRDLAKLHNSGRTVIHHMRYIKEAGFSECGTRQNRAIAMVREYITREFKKFNYANKRLKASADYFVTPEEGRLPEKENQEDAFKMPPF